MKLSELYKERMAALPELTRKKLVDTVGSATVYAIQHDVPRHFRKSTLQKLAELWKCSIGDIQACLAEMPNPLRKEVEKPEGLHVIGGKPKTKTEPAPDPEPEEEVDVMFPVETAAEETLAEFKARMKDICLRLFVEEEYSDNARLCIADRLLEEILK